MTAPVMLEDWGPFPFVVDTGANTSVIADTLAARLSLPIVGQAAVHGILGVEQAPLTRIRRLSIGEVSSKISRMPVLPHQQLGAEGLVGVDVLKNRRLTLNFHEKRLEIARSPSMDPVSASRLNGALDSGSAFVAPARFRFGQLVIVDGEVSGVKVIAFIDSGSQVTVGNLALKTAVVQSDRAFAARLVSAPLISATGQTVMAQLAPLPRLRLGGLRVSNMTTAFADLHIFALWNLLDTPAVLIGVDVLRYFRSVTIDYGLKRVVFRPPPDAQT